MSPEGDFHTNGGCSAQAVLGRGFSRDSTLGLRKSSAVYVLSHSSPSAGIVRLFRVSKNKHSWGENKFMETALEHLLAIYNWWMGVSTIAVMIGIFGEYVVELIFDHEIRQNKRKLAIRLFFGAIILAGVSGEYICGKKLSQASELLQQLADRDVARANAEAARAKAEAVEARNESAISLRQAEDANDRARKNEAESARLRKAAEEERLARIQLEGSTVERRLRTADQIEMANNLKDYSGQRAWIFYHDEDRETLHFSTDIDQTLVRARWLPTQPEATAKILTDGSPLPFQLRRGVWVEYSTDKTSFNAAQAVARELRAKGFEVHAQMASPLSALRDAPLVLITVEARPVGLQGKIPGSKFSKNTQGGAF